MIKKIILNFSLIIFLSVLFSTSCQAANYYVATTGDDTKSGTTQTQAWKTIQKAADTMAAGDTVFVNAGTYLERVKVLHSGTVSAPITYKAQGNVKLKGFTVNNGALSGDLRTNYIIIDGFEITATEITDSRDAVGIHIYGNNNIVKNNIIHNCPWGGIVIAYDLNFPSDKNVIQNNTIYHNGQFGLQVFGTNQLVENNDISDSLQYYPGITTYPTWVDSDGIRFFGSNHIIRGNYIHAFNFDGIYTKTAHLDCFQTWADGNAHELAHDIIFEKNICVVPVANSDLTMDPLLGKFAHGTGLTIEGNNNTGEDAYNITARNNIFNAIGGIYVNHVKNLQIINNTFIGKLGQIGYSRSVGMHIDNPVSVTVKNNIFYNFGVAGGNSLYIEGTTTGLNAGYNNIYLTTGTGAAPLGLPYSNDKWAINPQFITPPNPDYVAGVTNLHLNSASQIINAGVDLYSLGVVNDFDGTPRPQGSGYDIGAYEYVSHCTPLGDLDCSTKVNILDLSALLSAFGSTTNKTADLDNSGKVNMIDLSILLQNFGK